MSHSLAHERALLEQIAAGNEAAFTTLFDHYKDALYSLTWSLTRSYSVADDVLQEVFLKIWLNRDALGTIDNFHGYLVVVTRRVILNELRKQDRLKMREQHYSQNIAPADVDDIENLLQEKQYAEVLRQGMQQLSEQQAAVFRLIKLQGHSREDAAKALKLSQETVKKHLERAMRTIRAFLLTYLDHPLLLFLLIIYL
ncbi:RNA polymerase sigma factor [Chitinophaga sp. 30R24]|uniref:RNA polymerase sigma factor n=1 Tax=Chitinophaga sp. 30R24 TaxID=3248838 RepID=UPI003B901FD8